jgi:hypothetical protein
MVAAHYGAATRLRQHLTGDGFELDESEMTVLGLPLTLLPTACLDNAAVNRHVASRLAQAVGAQDDRP